MHFEQKKAETTIAFDLKEDHVQYFLQTPKIKQTFHIPYENIQLEHYEFTETNGVYKAYYQWAGITALAEIVVTFTFKINAMGWALIFALVSGFFYLRYKNTIIDYVAIECRNKRIAVMKDKQCNEIIKKIFHKRDEYMKEKYGKINGDEDFMSELNRIKSLRNMGVIKEEEFNNLKNDIITLYKMNADDIKKLERELK